MVYVDETQPTAAFNDPGVYRATPLIPSAEIDLPPWESLWFQSAAFTEEETDRYLELRESVTDDGVVHKLLGYPDPIQNEMETECQLASNGINCGDAAGYNDPRAGVLRAGAHAWRLLLQIDSEEDRAGMMWGDVGRLYFWIKEHDLRARRFEEVWCILQCC